MKDGPLAALIRFDTIEKNSSGLVTEVVPKGEMLSLCDVPSRSAAGDFSKSFSRALSGGPYGMSSKKDSSLWLEFCMGGLHSWLSLLRSSRFCRGGVFLERAEQTRSDLRMSCVSEKSRGFERNEKSYEDAAGEGVTQNTMGFRLAILIQSVKKLFWQSKC